MQISFTIKQQFRVIYAHNMTRARRDDSHAIELKKKKKKSRKKLNKRKSTIVLTRVKIEQIKRSR